MGTQDSKGVVPESSPYYVGTNYASVGPADVVLPPIPMYCLRSARGCSSGSCPTGTLPRIIHIDIDPDEIGRNLPTELGIVADAKTASAQLLAISKNLHSRGLLTPTGLPVSGLTSPPG